MPWLPRFTDLWRPEGSQIHRFFRGRRRGETGELVELKLRGPLGLAGREDPRVDAVWNWDPGSPEIRSVGSAAETLCYPGCQQLWEASLPGTGEQLPQLSHPATLADPCEVSVT